MHPTRKWPASLRASRPIVLATLLALFIATDGGATAAPAKDPREKEQPAAGVVHPLSSPAAGMVQPLSPPRSAAKRPSGPVRPEPAWRTGIIDSGQAPFAASLYRFDNQWHEIVDGHHVNVYAGALAQRPEQGILVLQTTPLQPGARPAAPAVIDAPGASGALHLVSVQGAAVIHVASASGGRFTFDVRSGDLRPD